MSLAIGTPVLRQGVRLQSELTQAQLYSTFAAWQRGEVIGDGPTNRDYPMVWVKWFTRGNYGTVRTRTSVYEVRDLRVLDSQIKNRWGKLV